MNYEIIWIKDKTSYYQNENLLKDFFNLYQDKSNFPDINELENPEFIKKRLIKPLKKNDPNSFLMVYSIIENNQKKTIAGAILEYYKNSECLLISYLFVNEKYRRNRIGEILLTSEEGLKGLIKHVNPKVVLFETNIPEETKIDSIDPSKRLMFFKKIGAKKINIKYIQPPLDRTKQMVTNLQLFCLPIVNKKLTPDIVKNFIIDVLRSLKTKKKMYEFILHTSFNSIDYDNFITDI